MALQSPNRRRVIEEVNSNNVSKYAKNTKPKLATSPVHDISLSKKLSKRCSNSSSASPSCVGRPTEQSGIFSSPKKPISHNRFNESPISLRTPEIFLDFSLFMLYDGNGDVLKEILSYFVTEYENENPRDGFLRRDMMNVYRTCRQFSVAVERIISSLLLPGEKTTLPCKSIHTNSKISKFNEFILAPQRRRRAFTAMDSLGKSILDKIFNDPVFCVQFEGIRQGSNVYPISEIATAQWPLQLQTFFKMRTYTHFGRLMSVYANRSYLPLQWIQFEVNDIFYANQMKNEMKENKQISENISSFCQKPTILEKGKRIQASHSIWTLGIEPESLSSNSDNHVLVASYIGCEDDECFICIRDCSTGSEKSSTSLLPRANSDSTEGALLGDGSEEGSTGLCGRFVTGDEASGYGRYLNPKDPGQSVRPLHPRWMFKLKQSEKLGQVLERVVNELQEIRKNKASYRFIAISPKATPSHLPTSTSDGDFKRFSVFESDTAPEASARAIYPFQIQNGGCDNVPVHVFEVHDMP